MFKFLFIFILLIKLTEGALSPTHPVVLFHLGSRKGDLGGFTREQIDQQCASNVQAQNMGCQNTTAFISWAEDHDICKNLMDLGQTGDTPIYSYRGVIVAHKFSDFVNKNSTNSLQEADVIRYDQSWWSGSFGNGTHDEGHNCQGWTSTSSSDEGTVGAINQKCGKILQNANSSCDEVNAIVCACYGGQYWEYE